MTGEEKKKLRAGGLVVQKKIIKGRIRMAERGKLQPRSSESPKIKKRKKGAAE